LFEWFQGGANRRREDTEEVKFRRPQDSPGWNREKERPNKAAFGHRNRDGPPAASEGRRTRRGGKTPFCGPASLSREEKE